MKKRVMKINVWIDRVARMLALSAHVVVIPAVLTMLILLVLGWTPWGLFLHFPRVFEAWFLTGYGWGLVALLGLLGIYRRRVGRFLFPKGKDGSYIHPLHAQRESDFKGVLIMLAFVCVVQGVCWLVFNMPISNVFKSRYFFFLAFGALIGGGLICSFFPLKKSFRIYWVVSGMICFLIVHLMVSQVSAIFTAPEFHYTSRWACDLTHGTRWTNRILPPGATEIDVRVRSWTGRRAVAWSCRVSKNDFYAFAKAQALPICLPPTGFRGKWVQESVGSFSEALLIPQVMIPPKRSVYLKQKDADADKIILYDMDTGRLYGHLSRTVL